MTDKLGKICLPTINLCSGGRVPIALISLNDAVNRRSLLARRGIPSEWLETYFPAVDMRHLELDEVLKFTDTHMIADLYGKLLRPPEVGCALSHIEAARWLLDTDYELMVVLEDDIVPTNDKFLDDLCLFSDILLRHAQGGTAFFCHLGQRFRPAMKNVLASGFPSSASGYSRLFLHCDTDFDMWQTHAYLISREAARRLVEKNGVIGSLADDWTRKFQMGILDQQFLCFPKIFSQNDEIPSTIQVDRKEAEIATAPDLIEKMRSSWAEGTFLKRLYHSVRYRFRAKLSHFWALFPYRIF